MAQCEYKEGPHIIPPNPPKPGGSGVIHMQENGTLDKTWNEIKDGLESGTLQWILMGGVEEGTADYSIALVTGISNYDDYLVFAVIFGDGAQVVNLRADSADGYPGINMGQDDMH